ncbi:MAG TPA: helix-turn-helix domain-containing protein [Steroidobacteraceae bacterium]|nr:helix-turn-helix domain-containing protein [Steroidobacteraceae bacterium]
MFAARPQYICGMQIKAWVSTFAAGLTEIAEMPYAMVCMHLGASVEVRCTRGGTIRHGREVAGDLDVIPARTASCWELKQEGLALVMCVPDELLRTVAVRLDRDPNDIDIADRFQMRDPVIEHIGWTLKADLDSNVAGGGLLRDSLGVALAARLLQRHYRGSLPMREIRGGLSHTKLERVIAHIEDNLASKLSLPGIAEIAGISVSHLKTLFRNSTGVPVYEYVLRRRVERAQLLLRNQKFSIAEVAVATGFAHQSHLARHMHRILGYTPSSLRRRSTRQPTLRAIN